MSSLTMCSAVAHRLHYRLLMTIPEAYSAVQIGVGQVIKGWDLGIAGGDGVPPMKVQQSRRFMADVISTSSNW